MATLEPYTPTPSPQGKDLLGAKAAKRRQEQAPWDAITRGQESLAGAVEGYGELLKPELMQQIGSALGGLNSIGALRSGAANVALNDIGTAYADRVGNYAATTAAQGAEIGLGVRQQLLAEKAQRDAKRAALLGSIGSVLGAGIGFLAGGPAGAAVGSQAGSSITSNGGGMV